jgi:hypothetical protein
LPIYDNPYTLLFLIILYIWGTLNIKHKGINIILNICDIVYRYYVNIHKLHIILVFMSGQYHCIFIRICFRILRIGKRVGFVGLIFRVSWRILSSRWRATARLVITLIFYNGYYNISNTKLYITFYCILL